MKERYSMEYQQCRRSSGELPVVEIDALHTVGEPPTFHAFAGELFPWTRRMSRCTNLWLLDGCMLLVIGVPFTPNCFLTPEMAARPATGESNRWTGTRRTKPLGYAVRIPWTQRRPVRSGLTHSVSRQSGRLQESRDIQPSSRSTAGG